MERKHILIGFTGVVILIGALGVAIYAGVGPAPGGDSDDQITDFPTATDSGQGSAPGAETASPSDTPPFTFTIEEIEECGQTCRDVTVTLHNNQDEPASGVTVFTRIFAGKNTTDSDDLVWEAKEEVGTLDAGESHTTTKRVELSVQEGLKIERNDGWITIVTTVQTDERTVTFRDNEQVA